MTKKERQEMVAAAASFIYNALNNMVHRAVKSFAEHSGTTEKIAQESAHRAICILFVCSCKKYGKKSDDLVNKCLHELDETFRTTTFKFGDGEEF